MTYVLKCPNQVVPQRRSLYREPRRSEPARTDPEVDRTTFRLLFRPRNPRGSVKRRQRRLFRVSSRARRLCRFSTRRRFSTRSRCNTRHLCNTRPRKRRPLAAASGRPFRARALQRLELLGYFGDRLLGVTEEHRGALGEEERVLDTGETGVHRALEHDDGLRLVDVEDRHSVNR